MLGLFGNNLNRMGRFVSPHTMATQQRTQGLLSQPRNMASIPTMSWPGDVDQLKNKEALEALKAIDEATGGGGGGGSGQPAQGGSGASPWVMQGNEGAQGKDQGRPEGSNNLGSALGLIYRRLNGNVSEINPAQKMQGPSLPAAEMYQGQGPFFGSGTAAGAASGAGAGGGFDWSSLLKYIGY